MSSAGPPGAIVLLSLGANRVLDSGPFDVARGAAVADDLVLFVTRSLDR